MANIFDGKDNHDVQLPSMNFSNVLELPDGDIVIAMTENAVTDPETVAPNTPLLKIPESVSDFYILITPDRENKVFPVKMNLIDTGAGKLKAGETLWFNLTNHKIIAKLGDAKMSVTPKGRTITRNPRSDSGYFTANFGYQADGDGKPAPITDQYWWHDANSRHVGFIVSTGGKLPRIYFFRDFRVKSTPAGGSE